MQRHKSVNTTKCFQNATHKILINLQKVCSTLARLLILTAHQGIFLVINKFCNWQQETYMLNVILIWSTAKLNKTYQIQCVKMLYVLLVEFWVVNGWLWSSVTNVQSPCWCFDFVDHSYALVYYLLRFIIGDDFMMTCESLSQKYANLLCTVCYFTLTGL